MYYTRLSFIKPISQMLFEVNMATDNMTLRQWSAILRAIHQKLIYLYLKGQDVIYYLDGCFSSLIYCYMFSLHLYTRHIYYCQYSYSSSLSRSLVIEKVSKEKFLIYHLKRVVRLINNNLIKWIMTCLVSSSKNQLIYGFYLSN